jgi:ABC-type proline/glycine betaine transport system permease subunit
MSTIEISAPSRLLRFSKIGVAAVLTTYALSEILGWRSIVLVVAFLAGTTYVRQVSTRRDLKQVHPVVKTVPMVALGLAMAQFSVSPSKAFIAFAAIAVVATVTSVVRPRPLWG